MVKTKTAHCTRWQYHGWTRQHVSNMVQSNTKKSVDGSVKEIIYLKFSIQQILSSKFA